MRSGARNAWPHLLKEVVEVCGREGDTAKHEGVKAHAHRIYIYRPATVMRLPLHDLWGQECWRAAKTVKIFVASNKNTRAAKVGELDNAIACKQNVFRLEITMDNLLGVQVF